MTNGETGEGYERKKRGRRLRRRREDGEEEEEREENMKQKGDWTQKTCLYYRNRCTGTRGLAIFYQEFILDAV